MTVGHRSRATGGKARRTKRTTTADSLRLPQPAVEGEDFHETDSQGLKAHFSEKECVDLTYYLRPPAKENEEDVDLTDRKPFNIAVAILICVNSLLMGLEHSSGGSLFLFQVFEHIFTAVFLIEGLIKIYYKRLQYLKDPWNVVDIIVVVISVLDNWVLAALLQGDEGLDAVSVLRLVRLTRLLRMFKMLKMRKDVRVLLEGMSGAFHSLVPIGIMLSVAIYAMALVCLSMIKPEYEALKVVYEDAELHWGSLPRALLTLFNIVILAEWDNIVWPLWDVVPGLIVALVIFVFLTSFGLLNVIIGIISESVTAAGEAFDKEQDQVQRSRMLDSVRMLSRMLEAVDQAGDGVITEQELKAAKSLISDPKFGFPVGFQPEELMTMLDFDGDKKVTHMEFISSMLRLIICDDFQHRCLMSLHLNMIKEQLHELVVQECASMKEVISVGLGASQSLEQPRKLSCSGEAAAVRLPPAHEDETLLGAPEVSVGCLRPLLRATELSIQALLSSMPTEPEPELDHCYAPRPPLTILMGSEAPLSPRTWSAPRSSRTPSVHPPCAAARLPAAHLHARNLEMSSQLQL